MWVKLQCEDIKDIMCDYRFHKENNKREVLSMDACKERIMKVRGC